ncbi:DUF6214 family protein [Streptomyces parvulus]|uniref:DUF6214 family protein n=1 Tax=Streptomyces parvulus TaxID=146923 RepID=UPI001E535C3B|nr:DUF6214 family protein [Streptomyces parvulus]MCC9152834.1 DUF6214 family protein [Streptomyces parvulus]MCE7687018.1 DUF6214 family protein [Streptomyces parvulus]
MSVRHAWVVRDGGTTASWFDVRLAFADGARVDALAVLSGREVRVEGVRAEPPLSIDDLAVLAEWLENPLFEACVPPPARGVPAPSRRTRPARPRGREERRLVAREYREAREDGADPVLAVMRATGHSRRKSLRLIGQARDEGFLAPRRARR